MARKSSKLFEALKVPRHEQAPTKNFEGYPAWERPLEEKYLQCLLTNTLGNTYYATAKDLLKESLALHEEMMKKDPAFVAKALVFARNKGFMRTQPILGLAMLASVSKEHFEQAFDEVIRTPNDLSDFFSILTSIRKGEGGRRVKRAAGKWLVKNLSEYWTIKYGAEKGEDSYSLRDLIQTVHPDFGGKRVPLVDYIMSTSKGRFTGTHQEGKKKVRHFAETELTELPQIRAFEALKTAKTEDQKVTAIIEGRLPHEVASSFAGKSAKVWNAIIPNMPIFATLRHLATMEKHGVLEGQRKVVEGKLTDKDTIQKSKIFPFRFLEAFNHVGAGWARDALRAAVELSFGNVPDIQGRTAVFLDISGSMHGFIQQAALFAVSLMKKTKGNGQFYLFNTQLQKRDVSMHDSILTQVERIGASGGTDHSVAISELIRTKEKVDNIVYITDEQQNTGSPVLALIDEYRKKVNKHVRLFIINVTPSTGSGAMVPYEDPNTWFIYGWSDQVLSFISMMSQGWKNMADYIRNGSPPEA